MSDGHPRVVAIVQARMGSTRLPGKVLRPLSGMPLLFHVITRLKQANRLTGVVVATTQEERDQAIADVGRELGVPVYQGPTDDVLARYLGAAADTEADVVVRITADCPLVDPVTVDRAVETLLTSAGSLDCVNVGVGGGFPRGLDCEVVTREALLRVNALASAPEHREHVTLLILRRRDWFRVVDLSAPAELTAPHVRLCVDEPADLELIEAIYDRLYRPGSVIDVREALALLSNEPALAAINAHVKQKITV